MQAHIGKLKRSSAVSWDCHAIAESFSGVHSFGLRAAFGGSKGIHLAHFPGP